MKTGESNPRFRGYRIRLGPSWGVNAGHAPRTLPIRFNSGPTPRDAILDLMHLLDAEPQVWRLMGQ